MASRNCVFERSNLDILGLNSYISRCWRWCYGPPAEKCIYLHPESPACYLYVTCRFYDIWKTQYFNTKRNTSMLNQHKRKRVWRCATNWLQFVCEDSGRVTCRRLNAMSAMIWLPRLWSLSCRLPCWKQRPKQPNVRGKCLADDQSSIELYGTASLIWHELTPNCTPRPKEIQMPNALVVGYLWRSLVGLAGVVDRQHAFFDDVCIVFITYNMYVQTQKSYIIWYIYAPIHLYITHNIHVAQCHCSTCRTSTTTSYATSTPATSSNASTGCVRCRMSVVCHMLFLIRVFRIRIELFKHIIQTLWMLNLVNLPITHFHRSYKGPYLHPFDGYTPAASLSWVSWWMHWFMVVDFHRQEFGACSGSPTCLAEIARITVGCS